MSALWFLLGVYCVLIGPKVVVLGQSDDVISSAPRVNINQGTVVGTAVDDETYYEFYGIPYADSTSGINRFKAPSAPPNFQNEFIANRKNIKCVRALGVGYEGTEDCLVVNVLTPTLNNTSRLPVMVWIRGTELDAGNDPEFSFKSFLEKNVVIVDINYRQSILGFLCLGTETAPGNAGLKDIIAGLRWVQQNIAAFGGDPENVSLFGHGSGAASVDLISLSSSSKNLVHKAITQSGTAMAPWAVTRNNLKYAVDVAKALGHTVPDIETLSNVLTRTSVAALMAVINELDLIDNSLAFAPCLEKQLENVEPFLIKSPYQTILEREQLQIPFMTGFVDIEGTVRAAQAVEDDWLERMEESFIDFIPSDIEFSNEEQEAEKEGEIKTFYFGTDSINTNSIDQFLNYQGDTIILVSAIREVNMRATSSNAPIYLYQFSYKGTLSQIFDRPVSVNRAGHREELPYLFYNEENMQANTLDLTVGDILVERWTNFAKYGEPTSETSQVSWRPYTTANKYFLRILDASEINQIGNSALEVELENPHSTTVSFWESIYSEHFLDAKSIWSLSDRTEGEDEDVIVEGGDGEGSGEEGNDITDGGEGSGDVGTEEDDNDPNSATSMASYTFAIITFFAILQKFHYLQIIS